MGRFPFAPCKFGLVDLRGQLWLLQSFSFRHPTPHNAANLADGLIAADLKDRASTQPSTGDLVVIGGKAGNDTDASGAIASAKLDNVVFLEFHFRYPLLVSVQLQYTRSSAPSQELSQLISLKLSFRFTREQK